MHPSPPKKEEELAEYVEMWQDKTRRLEAHGEQFKLAPLFNINALRMLMTGNTSTFGRRTATPPTRRRPTRAPPHKDKDYARRRKLDITAKERMQQGGDPMDVGVSEDGVGRITIRMAFMR